MYLDDAKIYILTMHISIEWVHHGLYSNKAIKILHDLSKFHHKTCFYLRLTGDIINRSLSSLRHVRLDELILVLAYEIE